MKQAKIKKIAEEEKNKIILNQNRFDVAVISREHKTRPHLGISRANEQIIQTLLSLDLKVCLITESFSNLKMEQSGKLTILEIPRSKSVSKAINRTKIPHPVSAWLIEVHEFVGISNSVIAPVVNLQSLIFQLGKYRKVRKVITLYSPYARVGFPSALYYLFQKQSLKSGDLLIANSHSILEKFRVINGDNHLVIPNFSSAITDCSSSTKKPLNSDYLWIGTFSWRKGVDRLALLIPIVRKKKRIAIISNSRNLWTLIFNLYRRFGWCEIEKNLTDSELWDCVSGTNAMLSTTRFESFGMTIIEAASLGKGMVGIYAKSIAETMPEESGGSIYFNSTFRLSQYINSHNQLNKERELGIKAKLFAAEKYDPKKIQNLWKSVFIFNE